MQDIEHDITISELEVRGAPIEKAPASKAASDWPRRLRPYRHGSSGDLIPSLAWSSFRQLGDVVEDGVVGVFPLRHAGVGQLRTATSPLMARQCTLPAAERRCSTST